VQCVRTGTGALTGLWLGRTTYSVRHLPPVAAVLGLRSFLQRTVQACRRDGYVTTYSGRRRYLPAIKDTNPHARAHVRGGVVVTRLIQSAKLLYAGPG